MFQLQLLSLFWGMAKVLGWILLYTLSSAVGIALIGLIVYALVSLIKTSNELKKIRIILEKSLLSRDQRNEISELDEDEY